MTAIDRAADDMVLVPRCALEEFCEALAQEEIQDPDRADLVAKALAVFSYHLLPAEAKRRWGHYRDRVGVRDLVDEGHLHWSCVEPNLTCPERQEAALQIARSDVAGTFQELVVPAEPALRVAGEAS